MSNNGAKNGGDETDVTRLGGHDFKIVKQGLDIVQVSSYLEELTAQRNELLTERNGLQQREEHLKSLSRLAEKTVMEADKLAEEIKAEALKKTEV